MTLLEVDIKKILGAVDWGDQDVKELEALLQYAGKDGDTQYEHFRLTQAINSYKQAMGSLRLVIKNYEERKGEKVELTKSKPTTAVATTPVPATKSDGLLIDRSVIIPVITDIVDKYPNEVALIDTPGNLGFLTGKVCVAVGGKGDPRLIQEMIGEYLDN